MTPSPPSRCLCSPSAATQCCTNPRAPAAPLYTPLPKGAPRGRSLKPCLSFYFFFFFFAFGREKNRVFDSALFMFLLGNKRWLCVCVFFLCWFFKEMGRRKKKNSLPFPRSCSPPPLPSFRHPSSRPFCSVVLFCYESTFRFVILGSPGFLFSVKSRYASSALCLLLPPPGPVGLGWAWPARSPSPSLPPSPPPSAPTSEESRRPGGALHIWRAASAI